MLYLCLGLFIKKYFFVSNFIFNYSTSLNSKMRIYFIKSSQLKFYASFLHKVFFIFCCLISFSFTSSDQNNLRTIDSLKAIINSSGNDTVLMSALGNLSRELKSIEPQNALQYGIEALRIAEKLDMPHEIAQNLGNIGVVYWQMGNFSVAIDFHLEASKISARIGDSIGIARSYNNLGVIYNDQGLYAKALEYFLPALEIYSMLDYKQGMAPVYNNIGLVYQNQGSYDLAEAYQKQSLEIKNELGDSKGISFSLNNLGIIYQKRGDIESAIKYFEQALEIRKSLGEKREMANSICNLGNALLEKGNVNESLKKLFEAIDIYLVINDQQGLANGNLYVGKAYYTTGAYKNALEFYFKAINHAQLVGLKRLEGDIFFEMSKAYFALNDLPKAYLYQSKYINLRDSLQQEEHTRLMSEIQIVHEKEKKDFEVELIKKKVETEALSKRQGDLVKNLLILLVVMVSGFAILFYNRFLAMNKVNKQLEEQKNEIADNNSKLLALNKTLFAEKQKTELLNEKLNQTNQKLSESEKHLLDLNATKDKFFSIISHDLRNPFASIVSFSRLLKRNLANMSVDELQGLVVELDKSVFKINNLLENLLQWSRAQTGKIVYKPGYLLLRELIKDNVNLLMANAKDKEINLVNEVNEDIIAWADVNMTDTVIRNLLSNALKYTDIGGRVSVSVRQKAGWVYVSVSDNGVGISPENIEKLFRVDAFFSTYGTQDEKGSGLGLPLCKEFVEHQGGTISLESKIGKGTIFTFSLPFEENTLKKQS